MGGRREEGQGGRKKGGAGGGLWFVQLGGPRLGVGGEEVSRGNAGGWGVGGACV